MEELKELGLVANHKVFKTDSVAVIIANYKDNKIPDYPNSIVFYEQEVKEKSAIVDSMINHKLGKSIKIHARKCEIKVVPTNEAREFNNRTHLKGNSSAPTLGLYHSGNLVMLLSYKTFKTHIELHRLCTELNMVVIGGFSKLLKHLIKTKQPKIILSYVDLRYHSGSGYSAVGFEKVKTSESWYWTDGENRYNRLQCRANMDKRGLSQKEHAKELGWWKIYDRGQALFELKLQKPEDNLGWAKVKKLVENYNFVLNTTEKGYERLDYNKRLTIECEKGHVFRKSETSILEGLICPQCEENRPKPVKQNNPLFKEILAEKGWTYVSGEYANKSSYLVCKCPQGCLIENKMYRWFRDKTECPKCKYQLHNHKEKT